MKSYPGGETTLGPAEQFVLRLTSVPAWALRISCLLLVVEWAPSLDEVEAPLRLLLSVCRRLTASESLKDFLALTLQLGNYLNAVISFSSNVFFIVSFTWTFLEEISSPNVKVNPCKSVSIRKIC